MDLSKKVKIWSQEEVIPTYGIGYPEKNPLFLEKRVYQGSSGAVYPYPVIEKIYDTKEDITYEAFYLENEFIKVMILPQLGGRVQMAYDKIKKRHFVYYNHVIKPALVGLTGPWISGGIEFNWPQHHRPSTYLPVDWKLVENEDGSATVWVNEIERMFGQKGAAGFTLYPDKAYLEIKGRLFNRTPFPQTFLWWANPAVAVNDHYQSVFPPDVNAVLDHGKRDVSTFPIATGTYYKVDYSAGVDISRYKNIPVPTSYMAIKSKYEFVGGYENDTRAGVLHVANHNISPGKKQWTWGNGDFGVAWDRNLTDNDGPYIELMAGVFTDNQPDFTWLMPGEEKTFEQYFLPYRELGVVKNANKDILLNLEPDGDKLRLKVFATSLLQKASIVLYHNREICFEKVTDISPRELLDVQVDIDAKDFETLSVEIKSNEGKELISWQARNNDINKTTEPAKAAKEPYEIQTNEQLYLTGLHLEQYRHATYSPVDYYQEALKRDPSDVRNNNAMGLWLLRRGKFAESETFFRTAIETLLQRNPNPYDGEPLYNLGVALYFQERYNEAYEHFYKASWNAATKSISYLFLGRISAIESNYERALKETDQSLISNWHHHQSRHLKSALLRKTGCNKEALELTISSLQLDGFNVGCLYEKWLLGNASDVYEEWLGLMRDSNQNYRELALDYVSSGFYKEALDIMMVAINRCPPNSINYYYAGWICGKMGREKDRKKYYKMGKEGAEGMFFPNKLWEILILSDAIAIDQMDGRAAYLLGNIWYDKKQYTDAITCWEQSARVNPEFHRVYRNLALAYYNKLDEKEKALKVLEKAHALDPTDARIVMELDQLYKKLNKPYDFRLTFLKANPAALQYRDDLYLEQVTLLNQQAEYSKAKELIAARKFHPWEGGEGKVQAQYMICRLGLTMEALKNKNFAYVVQLMEEAMVYPENLGEGKLITSQDNDLYYYLGLGYEGLGENNKARAYFTKASEGLNEPSDAMYYNDQQPDKIFYKGLALLKLGKNAAAESTFNSLISYGEKHMSDKVKIDYFAVSLPDLLVWEEDLNVRNKIHCYYLIGLGYLGHQDLDRAKDFLSKALALNLNHQGVQRHMELTCNKDIYGKFLPSNFL
jgi:tetratricopeptide (TPR) repeat protein